jgi:hypothetical protein
LTKKILLSLLSYFAFLFYIYSFDYPQKDWIRLWITQINADRNVINLTETFFANEVVGWFKKNVAREGRSKDWSLTPHYLMPMMKCKKWWMMPRK